jgi:hypothetical protein
VEEAESYTGEVYTRYRPCTACQGSGKQTRWVSLTEFAALLNNAMQADVIVPNTVEQPR